MYLEIISPEAKLFAGEVDSVIVPGSEGSFQILNNHASIVSTLKEGIIKISGRIDIDDAVKDKFETEDSNTTLFKINSGTVEMRDNKLILLTD